MDPHHDEPDYDYAAARKAGVSPDPVTGHMDSRFKKDWHARRFLNSEKGIYDTKYNRLVPQKEFETMANEAQRKTYKTERLPAKEVEGYLRNEAETDFNEGYANGR